MVPPYLYLTIFFPQALFPNIGSPAPHSISHWRKRSWDLIILLRLAGLGPTPNSTSSVFSPRTILCEKANLYTGRLPASALPLPAGPLDDRAQLSPLQDRDSSHLPREWPWAWRQVSTRVWPCRSRPLGRTLWGQARVCSPWPQLEGANPWQHQRATSLVWMGHQETILQICEKSASGSTAIKWKETI